MDDLHSVHTVIDEGEAFIERNNLDGAAASMGGLTWGLLRAIAECPDCPGIFRVPLDDDWNMLYCPSCKGIWAKKDTDA